MKTGARARIAVRTPSGHARRVVVKARVVRTTRDGLKAAALHLKYIERDGVERDGSPGRLYTSTDESPETLAAEFEARLEGERHQFRFIVSPEDGGELELAHYVRRLMAHVERDTGRRLCWAAVNHYDTDNPHAHIVIRGVDRDGLPVRLDRAYIANGMRWRAQELATQELGPRPAIALEKQRLREVSQKRFTNLDRELGRLAVEQHIDTVSLRRTARTELSADLLLARLGQLRQLGLASRETATSWRLAQAWQERLRELGERGDVIAQMHHVLRADQARYHVLRRGQALPRVVSEVEPQVYGRLVAKVLTDELRGDLSAIVESAAGSGYLVPIDQRTAERVREGDVVRISSRSDEGPSRVAPRLELELERPIAEQVGYRGPVWLDQVNPRTLARHGFGVEVLQAVARRREELARMGIQRPDPQAELEERERKAVAERYRLITGQHGLSVLPEKFRGRATIRSIDDYGARHVVVSDGARFIVVRAGRSTPVRDGEVVNVERGPDGKPRVRSRRGKER